MNGKRVVLDEVVVPMRDGTGLAADVVLLDDGMPRPVLLLRTPYSRAGGRMVVDVAGLARSGWTVVVQDTRGRFDSEGVFDPFHQERRDGADTVAWCAAQPWSDGRVAMSGGSYLGITQLMCALEQPPALGAITPMMAPSDFRDGFMYEGGAFQLGLAAGWATTIAASDPRASDTRKARAGALATDLNKLYRTPLGRSPLRRLFGPYERWLDPDDRDYWTPLAISRQYRRTDVPGFHLGGWYDVFCEGTLRNHAGMVAEARSERARRSQRLIIGPWPHGGLFPITPEMDFGSQAAGMAFTAQQYEWLRTALEGNEVDSGVSVFVMGTNRWQDLSSWPPPSTPMRLHLDAGALGANSAAGDGRLGEGVPPSGRDVFRYDPRKPVPTRGGRILGGWLPLAGPVDQRLVEERRDVLVYTSEPLTLPITVMGMVTAEIAFATTARSADVAVKLCDVHPDGRAFNVVDSLQRSMFTPGRRKVVKVNVGSTAITFLPGHRLRVEVSSSNFPRFDRNPSTGEPPGTATRLEGATQTVFRGGTRPSAVVLPVVGP